MRILKNEASEQEFHRVWCTSNCLLLSMPVNCHLECLLLTQYQKLFFLRMGLNVNWALQRGMM